MSLNAKQTAFVEFYCSNGFNATQAAISAGYSENTAESQASRLLTNVKVKTKVDEFKSISTERALVTIEDVVKGLLLEATSNGEGCTQSARVAAWKALSEHTGGFDANKQKVEHSSPEGVTFNMSYSSPSHEDN